MHSRNPALQGYGEAAGGRTGWWWDVESGLKGIANQARHETRDAPCFLKLLRGQFTDLAEQRGRLRTAAAGLSAAPSASRLDFKQRESLLVAINRRTGMTKAMRTYA